MSKGLYLILSLLPVLVAIAIGLIIGLLQTITQIQEQTLPFGLKLVAVFICLLMQTGWLAEKVIAYATEMFNLAFSTGNLTAMIKLYLALQNSLLNYLLIFARN